MPATNIHSAPITISPSVHMTVITNDLYGIRYRLRIMVIVSMRGVLGPISIRLITVAMAISMDVLWLCNVNFTRLWLRCSAKFKLLCCTAFSGLADHCRDGG